MTRLLFALVIFGFLVDSAEAQLFRRRFRGSCSTGSCPPKVVQQEQVVVAEPVAPVVEKTDVFVVQNNNPAPLVAQGSTLYSAAPTSYQGAVLPFFDPNAYFEQELQLQRAADQTAALRAERTAKLVEKIAELQAPAIQKLATGQAAALVLKAAGLDPQHNKGGSSGVVVTRDANGKVIVVPLDPAVAKSIAAKTTSTSTVTVKQTIRSGNSGKYPAVTKFCGKCHGTQRSDPDGGFYIGEGKEVARVMKQEWFKITRKVTTGAMPPPSSPQPSQDEKAQILNEIEQMILSSGE